MYFTCISYIDTGTNIQLHTLAILENLWFKTIPLCDDA